MARRRSWSELAPAYRRRLARGGVNESDYAAGASLSSARGHARTPERPVQVRREPTAAHPQGRKATGPALSQPARYADYLARQYPDLVTYTDDMPELGSDWTIYRDPTLRRAVEYADAIGNPEYVHAYITPDGTVILAVKRPRRTTKTRGRR